MERLVAEEISDSLTGVAIITGQVEKLVRGRWTDRWLTVCVQEASIHYFLSKSDQSKGKVRGIYPLHGVKVKEKYVGEENGPYEFCLVFQTDKKVHFRTNVKNLSHAWSVIISHLADKLPEKQGEAKEGILSMKSGIGWKEVLARLDTDLRELSLVKVGHHDEGASPKEETCNLEGVKLRPLKSYGKTFEFILSLRSSSHRHPELRLKASSESERTEWCQALQSVIENRTELRLNSSEGLDEGTIYLAEKSEKMPNGKEVNEVVLMGLQAFSPKVMTRVKYYLQPYPIIHTGEVSKVYNANLKFVSLALMNAGFLPGIQDTTSNLVFEMKARAPVTLESKVTIDDIASVLLPVRFPQSTSRPQSGDVPTKPSNQSSTGILNVSSSSSSHSSSSSSPSSSITSLSLPPSPSKKPTSPSLRLKSLITKR